MTIIVTTMVIALIFVNLLTSYRWARESEEQQKEITELNDLLDQRTKAHTSSIRELLNLENEKQGKTVEDEILNIRFYFTSGNYIDRTAKKTAFIALRNHLEDNWNMIGLVTSEYGINFSNVTHYEVLQ